MRDEIVKCLLESKINQTINDTPSENTESIWSELKEIIYTTAKNSLGIYKTENKNNWMADTLKLLSVYK